MAISRVGIIGCGRPRTTAGATGYGMSHLHAIGYRAASETRIVALADTVPAHARAFQEVHGGDALYTDYREMLARERLDIVSVCTWPHLHAEMVIAAAEAGVRAIHCEKPMAPTWAEARRMVQISADRGVQLTFNHQRRLSPEFRRARELLRSGAIGDLLRLEGTCPNLFDWGTHWFDMFFFYNDETPAEWVLGQVEPRGGRSVFGVQIEGQAISSIGFRNGVTAWMATSMEPGWPTTTRMVGTDGVIEAGLDAPLLRIQARGTGGWEAIGVDGDTSFEEPITAGVVDLVEALRTGREPELSARRALAATELIFATYASARHGGRVDLPLRRDDASTLAHTEPPELSGAP